MKGIRIIARLDVKGPNVVKGVQFECLRVMGKPKDLAETYYMQGADELIYIDIVANLYQRQNLVHIIDQATDNIFIPLTAGGGVRDINDIRTLLEAGADKVAINTAATKNPGLIEEAARIFGSQCIVSSIEAKKIGPKKWEAYCDNGRQRTGLDAVEWAKKVEGLGAGEILLTSVDNDGTEQGFDLELIEAVSDSVSIPVIASGGAGRPDDFIDCASKCRVDAIAAASILHYGKYTISDVKKALSGSGVNVRPSGGKDAEGKGPEVHAYDIEDYNKYTFRHLENKHLEEKEYGGRFDFSKYRAAVKTSYDIGVINCGINNVKSVLMAFEKIGRDVNIIETKEELLNARCLILPGVGTFEHGMLKLAEKGLVDLIKKQASYGIPLLGICLGMQLLFSESEEYGLHKGLGLMKGRVVSLKRPEEVREGRYRIPHMGWNQIKKPGLNKGVDWKDTVLKDAENNDFFYFAHSFYPVVEDPRNVAAVSEYGGQEFCAVVEQGNICGLQFHPEKSGEEGLGILKSFCEINGV